MKKITINFLAMLTILIAYQAISTSSFAQAPQKMSYQAVIRDAGNNLITNQTIGMKISILQNTTPIYVEVLTPNTNAN